MKNGVKAIEPITVRPPRDCDLNKIAQELGMSRSHLVYLAIDDYLKRNGLNKRETENCKVFKKR
jgi:hypothetical protein